MAHTPGAGQLVEELPPPELSVNRSVARGGRSR